MKKALFTLSAWLFCFSLMAQIPQGINYQAVIRDGAGVIMANASVSLRFTIHETVAGGTTVYQETHAVNTNAQGLVTAIIGQGINLSGNFSTINWAADAYFLQVDVDNGSGFTNLGTSQFMSVPYALAAGNSGGSSQWTTSGSDIYYTGGSVGVGVSGPQQNLSVANGLNIDQNNLGQGTLDNGLTFGDASGEGIASDRTGASSNLYGLDFYTSFANRMSINNSGEVGIGTSNPGYSLDVESPNYTAVYVNSATNGGTALVVDEDAETGNIWAVYGSAPTSGYAGDFNGNVYCTGSYQPSDERLKENIQPMQNMLEKVMQLDVKTYNFKQGLPKMNLPANKQYGFIAQNMMTVFPELVRLNEAKADLQPMEFNAVNYIGMVPILTSAMQEQQQTITALQTKLDDQNKLITDLQNDMTSLKSRIDQLENK